MFQSTPACVRATPQGDTVPERDAVSIHARVCAGDDVCQSVWQRQRVSIHARVCAGDQPVRYGSYLWHVSIHARVCAGDRRGLGYQRASRSFNPRPRVCGRRGNLATMNRVLEVSIHARVCAGDVQFAFPSISATPFQSTPACVRATRSPDLPRPLRERFNPRPRVCGRLHGQRCARHPLDRFNPRPRVCGRPPPTPAPPTPIVGFNPRPRVCGRRPVSATRQSGPGCFNPRPRVCGRRHRGDRAAADCLFQSTPACVRATALVACASMAFAQFQSTPACVRATREEDK